jgi:hypothetical protein
VRFLFCVAFIVALCSCVYAQNTDEGRYDHRIAFSVFANYSNDSSHIILGISENRKIAGFGASYQRRLIGNDGIEWSYEAEVLPVLFESDPVGSGTDEFLLNGIPVVISNGPNPITFSGPRRSSCQSGTFVSIGATTSAGTYTTVLTQVCGRQWTYTGGLSPLGQRISFAKRHRLQPFLVANAGFLASTRDIPMDESSSFNFTFEGGAGIEWFRNHEHSFSFDYRLHHLSNDFIGASNPGVDSGIFRVTYSFGR